MNNPQVYLCVPNNSTRVKCEIHRQNCRPRGPCLCKRSGLEENENDLLGVDLTYLEDTSDPAVAGQISSEPVIAGQTSLSPRMESNMFSQQYSPTVLPAEASPKIAHFSPPPPSQYGSLFPSPRGVNIGNNNLIGTTTFPNGKPCMDIAEVVPPFLKWMLNKTDDGPNEMTDAPPQQQQPSNNNKENNSLDFRSFSPNYMNFMASPLPLSLSQQQQSQHPQQQQFIPSPPKPNSYNRIELSHQQYLEVAAASQYAGLMAAAPVTQARVSNSNSNTGSLKRKQRPRPRDDDYKFDNDSDNGVHRNKEHFDRMAGENHRIFCFPWGKDWIRVYECTDNKACYLHARDFIGFSGYEKTNAARHLRNEYEEFIEQFTLSCDNTKKTLEGMQEVPNQNYRIAVTRMSKGKPIKVFTRAGAMKCLENRRTEFGEPFYLFMVSQVIPFLSE